MKKPSEDWLTSADDDLRLIEKILDDGSLTNMTAFHAQQAVEKSLKSILEEFEGKVPKTHNIIRLKELADKYLMIGMDQYLLEQINEVYTDTRYPSAVGLVPAGKPSLESARKFYEFALKMRNDIRNKMKKPSRKPV